MTLKKIFMATAIIDVVGIVSAVILFDAYFLLNTQVALMSAILIIGATYYSYKSYIYKNISIYNQSIDESASDGNATINDGNRADKTLSSDEQYAEYHEKELGSLSAINNKDDQKAQTKYFRTKSFLKFISLYRIIAYAFLVAGVMGLIHYELFRPVAYMVGITLFPVAILILKLFDVINTKKSNIKRADKTLSSDELMKVSEPYAEYHEEELASSSAINDGNRAGKTLPSEGLSAEESEKEFSSLSVSNNE